MRSRRWRWQSISNGGSCDELKCLDNHTNVKMTQGTRSKSNASLKTHDELTAMDREELLHYSIMVTGLCDKLLDIEKRMEALESEKLIQKNVNKLLKDRADKMEARIVQTETTVTNNSQYLRR